jgi:hypothetical protein
MVPEMQEAWPGCKFVAVDRPVEESVKSLADLAWWPHGPGPEVLIPRMIQARDEALAAVPADLVLRLGFDDLLRDPRASLERLAAFAGIEPYPRQYRHAMAFLDPQLKHYNGAPHAAVPA